MLIAILSDVHSNIEALDAVLARAAEEGATATWVLGDLVGYGADPVAVIERLQGLDRTVLLAGNHDLAATGRFDTTWFNAVAARAIEWTVSVLGETEGALSALEPRVDLDEALLVHGSVTDPAAEYVTDAEVARTSFEADPFGRCFFGHTHLPSAFTLAPSGSIDARPLADGELVNLYGGERVMLNPGSVGQPRDHDPRASFMLYDDEARTAVVHRVVYDIEGAQRKIRAAGLPDVLADRLSVGR